MAAQHGDSRRRSWFGRIAGSKRAELVILDSLLHRGFTRNPLRHDHTFTTTLRSQEFVVQTRPPALHAVRAAAVATERAEQVVRTIGLRAVLCQATQVHAVSAAGGERDGQLVS